MNKNIRPPARHWLLFLSLSLGAGSLLPATTLADDLNDDGPSELEQLRSRLSNEWQLVRYDRRHNIKTFARVEDGKRYRSFKVEAVLQGSMTTVARVLLDFPGYTEWFWQTRESKLIRQESGTEYFLYMVHKAPYGLPDRDTVIRAQVTPQSKGQPNINLRISAVPELVGIKPPLVRIKSEEMYLQLRPQPNNQVEMSVEGYFDPGGVVPVWAANLVQRSAPYTVLLALQRTMDLPAYRTSSKPLPFKVYDWNELP